jgi:hypothetical protein
MGTVRRGRIFLRLECRVWLFDREPVRVSGWERRDRVWLSGSAASERDWMLRDWTQRGRARKGSGLAAALGLWDEVASGLSIA